MNPLTQSLLAHPLYEQAPQQARQQNSDGLANALALFSKTKGTIDDPWGIASANTPEANLSGFAAGAGPMGPSGGSLAPTFGGMSYADLLALGLAPL